MSECGADASTWPDYNDGFPVERHISWVGCWQNDSEEVEVVTLTMGCDPLLRSSWHPASEDNFLTSVFKSSGPVAVFFHTTQIFSFQFKLANFAYENKITAFWKQEP